MIWSRGYAGSRARVAGNRGGWQWPELCPRVGLEELFRTKANNLESRNTERSGTDAISCQVFSIAHAFGVACSRLIGYCSGEPLVIGHPRRQPIAVWTLPSHLRWLRLLALD